MGRMMERVMGIMGSVMGYDGEGDWEDDGG